MTKPDYYFKNGHQMFKHQLQYEMPWDSGSNVKDAEDMYMASLETKWRFQNWHPEDLVAYVGGEYAKEAYA